MENYMSPFDGMPLEEIVERLLPNPEDITILEAGCGSMSHFRHPANARLVGIDISEDQLEKNTLLQEKIHGDLEEYVLPANAYDLIICWDVLEHLPKPQKALSNFARAVAPGGLILLASPNVLSLRGLLTKISPHWLKVLYYRYVVGQRDAGRPGTYPFKSYHRLSISPRSIEKFAVRNRLRVAYMGYSSWEHPEDGSRLFRSIWRPLNTAVSFLSLRRIGTDNEQGFQIILQKP